MQNFTRYEFVKYRAAHKFHVGGLAGDLVEGQEVEYDGTVLRVDGSDHTIPALRGAVNNGWLLPLNAEDQGGYVPQASDVRVRPAVVSDPRTKPARNLAMTVSQDEREVGSLKGFQDRKAATEQAVEGIRGIQARVVSSDGGNVGIDSVPVSTGAPSGNVGVNTVGTSTPSLKRGDLSVVAEQEGRVVSAGGFSTSTKTAPSSKDSIRDIEVKRTASQTQVSAAEFPWKKGEFHGFLANQRFGSGATDGYFEPEEYLEFDGWTLRYDGQDYTGQEAMKLRKAYEAGLISLYETTFPETEVESAPAETALEAPENSVALPNGEFWDQSPHWKTRGKIAIEKYKDVPDVLEAIIAVETKGVVKMINAAR